MPYYGCVERYSNGDVCCPYVTSVRPADRVLCAGEYDSKDEASKAAKALWRMHSEEKVERLNAQYDAGIRPGNWW
jgi:hypothetical protein